MTERSDVPRTPNTEAGKNTADAWALMVGADDEMIAAIFEDILAIEAQASRDAEATVAELREHQRQTDGLLVALRDALEWLHDGNAPPHGPDDAPCRIGSVITDSEPAARQAEEALVARERERLDLALSQMEVAGANVRERAAFALGIESARILLRESE